jgi:hypothetical protein
LTRVIDSSAARCHKENKPNTIAASRLKPPTARTRDRLARDRKNAIAARPPANIAATGHVIQKLGTPSSLTRPRAPLHRNNRRSTDGPDRDLANDRGGA